LLPRLSDLIKYAHFKTQFVFQTRGKISGTVIGKQRDSLYGLLLSNFRTPALVGP